MVETTDTEWRISQEKRELIQKTAKELNYHPNRNAVALATSSTGVIGAILHDVSNPYFAEFAKGAEDYASEQGYQLILVNMLNRSNKPKNFIDLLGFESTDGLIITRDAGTPELKDYIKYCYDEHKKPIANVGNGDVLFENGNVIFNNELGGYIATKHLLDLGHKRIGLTIGKDLSVVGFDDLEFSSFLNVPLTTVHQPAYEMGEASCRMVIEMIRTNSRTISDVHFELELVIRDSTGLYNG